VREEHSTHVAGSGTTPKRLALILVVLVIVCLNGIILWGAAAGGAAAIQDVKFGVLVLLMDLGLVVSSLLLTYLFWRERRLTWAVLFALNLVIMASAFAIRAAGAAISPSVLFAADLYWLQLYLLCLLREYHWLHRT
jgi:hypothetical protein